MGRFLEWFVIQKLARWFPARFRLITGLHGLPLLRQFKIFDWLFLQSFENPEGKDLFHRHRWGRMYSLVLSGWFIEERYPGDLWIIHQAPSFYSMDDTVIHRIHDHRAKSWTLFFMFGNEETWGYYPRPKKVKFVPWQEAIPEGKRAKKL